jgi:hypothetical protein
MYIVFNVFYFYSGVGQKDSGVGRAHLAPPFATPMQKMQKIIVVLRIHASFILISHSHMSSVRGTKSQRWTRFVVLPILFSTVIRRHNEVRDVLGDMMETAWGCCIREPIIKGTKPCDKSNLS